jgi:hypothetical protein
LSNVLLVRWTLSPMNSMEESISALFGKEFTPKWNGFRFGIDNEIGQLDPNLSEGALFIVHRWMCGKLWNRSLKNNECPHPCGECHGIWIWIYELRSQIHFHSRRLCWFISEFGWRMVEAVTWKLKMKREDYLLLKLHIQKLLFELGLLSVKRLMATTRFLLAPPMIW